MKTIEDFEIKKEFFKYLVENKQLLITEKKTTIKYADCVCVSIPVLKVNTPVNENTVELKTRLIINTTNIMDSHDDVHFPGLWNKTLKENKSILHLQEHQMAFDKIIADNEDLKAYTQIYNWKDLGIVYEGKTEALVFDSNVKKSRNEFMFNQYKEARVKNHSVGMQYVKLLLAVNDEKHEEHENWEKYYPEIINKELADEKGFFWAVKEAKIIEGSAVVKGSNWATPTLENNMKDESVNSTHEEESHDSTQKLKYLIDNFKL